MTFSFSLGPKKETPIDRVNRGLKTGRLRGMAFRGGQREKALHRDTRTGNESVATIRAAIGPLLVRELIHRRNAHRWLLTWIVIQKNPGRLGQPGFPVLRKAQSARLPQYWKALPRRILDADRSEYVVTRIHGGAYSITVSRHVNPGRLTGSSRSRPPRPHAAARKRRAQSANQRDLPQLKMRVVRL